LLIIGVMAVALAGKVPLVAAAFVLPVIYFVPGFALVRATAPGMYLAAQAGLAIVLSVAISAHLTYWIGWIGGEYSRTPSS